MIFSGRQSSNVAQEEVKYSEEHLGMDSPNTQQTRAYLADALAKNGNKVEPPQQAIQSAFQSLPGFFDFLCAQPSA